MERFVGTNYARAYMSFVGLNPFSLTDLERAGLATVLALCCKEVSNVELATELCFTTEDIKTLEYRIMYLADSWPNDLEQSLRDNFTHVLPEPLNKEYALFDAAYVFIYFNRKPKMSEDTVEFMVSKNEEIYKFLHKTSNIEVTKMKLD